MSLPRHLSLTITRLVPMLLALGVCSASAATSFPMPSGMRVFFNDASNQLSNNIDGELVAVLDSAQTSIDAHFYQVNRQPVVDAFVRAANRLGPCAVRFITDAHYYNHASYQSFYRQLENAGITVITETCDGSSDSSQESHNKFAVVDGTTVWTGSYNITDSGTNRHNENALSVASSSLATAYTTEFNEMWGATACPPGCPNPSRFGSRKTDNTSHLHSIPGAPLRSYFAPSDGVEAQIVQEIQAAQQGIYFCAFTFTSDPISAAMQARMQAGVQVQGVFDNLQANGTGSEYPILLAAGAQVKKDTDTVPYGDILHHKFIVIDPLGTSPKVITGSFNFTATAERSNDENVLIIAHQGVAHAYYQEFKARFDGTLWVPPTPVPRPTNTPLPTDPDDGGCFASALAKRATNPHVFAGFYRIRDLLRLTSIGEEYVEFYYQYSPEFVGLLLRDEQVRLSAEQTLLRWRQHAVAQQDGPIITGKDVQALSSFLRLASERADGDGLKVLLGRLETDLARSEGMTLHEFLTEGLRYERFHGVRVKGRR